MALSLLEQQVNYIDLDFQRLLAMQRGWAATHRVPAFERAGLIAP